MAVYHARSHSLPSSLHPFVLQIDEQLCRIKSLEAATTSSSSSSVCGKLCGLQDLHNSVEKLLLLPLSQQALTQEQNEGVDELLDGSLRLLDACSSAKDALLHTKECTQELQSSLRRRCGDETEIKKYSASRKIVKKAIQKALGKLKCMDGVLASLYGHKASRCDKHMLVENVHSQLKDLEQCIQDLEDCLECLYRQLIKTRVSFLNIFSP